jgi:hypothetical protein
MDGGRRPDEGLGYHLRISLVALDLGLVGLATVLLLQRRRDVRRLRQFVDDFHRSPRAHELVLDVARRCFLLPYRGDPVFYPRLFGPLGATPSAVIRLGGCCSDRSRLLILALAELGIRAYQITLYHRAGHAQHCLVEACLGADNLIVDPSYGIYYVSSNGGAISLRDLQAGELPVSLPLANDRPCGYPANAYYDFDFRASKTANWTKTPARRIVYRTLHRLSAGAVDQLKVPALLEWPQHLFIAIVAACATVMNAAAMLLAF